MDAIIDFIIEVGLPGMILLKILEVICKWLYKKALSKAFNWFQKIALPSALNWIHKKILLPPYLLLKKKIRANRAGRLWRLKNLRRDPSEVTRAEIKACTHFILFVGSFGFYVSTVLILSSLNALPSTLSAKLTIASPVFFFEILWLLRHSSADDLAKQRRKLFYKPTSKAAKGEKDNAS